jgi:hypothetical protein
MRYREFTRLADRKVYIPVTNEESVFLRKHGTEFINLEQLEPRDHRIAENLLLKDILCKIGHKQLMVNNRVSTNK